MYGHVHVASCLFNNKIQSEGWATLLRTRMEKDN
jgi:hypothetical protein